MKLFADADLTKGLTGGLILGCSTSVYMYLTGRVTGISGITGNLLTSSSAELEDWSAAYVLGLLSSGAIALVIEPGYLSSIPQEAISPIVLATGGILVGFGTRLSNGCTSGHGLCGLGRMSLRSFVAVCSFMATGALGAYLRRLIPPAILSGHQEVLLHLSPVTTALSVVVLASVYRKQVPFLQLFSGKLSGKQASHAIRASVVSFASGLVFGTGLLVSGMVFSSRVLGFLDFSRSVGWDYTLAGVMGGGVLLNLAVFPRLAKRSSSPTYAKELLPADQKSSSAASSSASSPPPTAITWQLVTGALLFGLGWGVTGVCPGPSLVLLGAGVRAMHVFVPAMAAGMVAHAAIFNAKK